MKFPKSVHAEGWLDHMEKTTPEHLPDALAADARPRAAVPRAEPIEPAGMQRPHTFASTASAAPAAAFSASAAPVIAAPKRSSSTPWVVGAGAAVVVIAVAMTVSHNMPSRDATAVPPTVTGEAKPSPEDAQLAAAPTAAGPMTPEPAQPSVEQPAAPPAPVVEPAPTTVAAAPTPAPAPKVQAPAPQPVAPVAKTLTPPPETLAQASPPPVTLRDPVQPVQPVTPTVTPSPQPVMPTPTPTPTPTPEQAAPTVPPMAQAQPVPDTSEDTGITSKVRTALASDAVLAAVSIVVSTDHGVVKLEGQAPDTQARERATVVAAATQGVKAVDNRLTLPPVAQAQQLEPQQVARAPSSD